MSEPISPPPVKGPLPSALPALLSNGVVGLRVRDIPLLPGVAVLSGLAGRHPVTFVEAAAHAPYPLTADIWIDRTHMSDVLHQVTGLEQRYDFSCGELHTRFLFTVGRVRATIEVLTFCSRSRPSLVLQEIAVTVNRTCDLTLRATLEPHGVHGRLVSRFTGTPGQPDAVDGSLCWETLGGLSQCGIAYVTDLGDHRTEASCTREEWGEQSPLSTAYAVRARPGERYALRQIVSLIPQHLHHQPDRQATRIAAFAAKLGFEALRQDNRDSWTELWRGRIHLVGASRRWQALTDASFFYLNSCAHGCSPASTGIFGLAEWHDYHYYYGHVMWDLETFMFPVLLLMQPFAARSILDYRTDCLDAARRNARLNGYRGIQFPWESGTTRGEESAPGAGTAAWHEDHVSADVALAFVQYAHATGDDQFSQRQAWPVLNGVADWIASRVMRTDDGFTLRRSMGIAERKTPSDNAAFTVMGMKRVLREAMAESERHLRQVPPEWAAIERGLDLPMNRSGAIVSYDGYRRADEKSATPDPLAGLLLLGYDVDSATERATLKYFLARAQEYIGSPMLSALYGVWAAWAGDRRLSAKLLDEGFGDFAADRFTQILEYRPDRFADETPAGPFMANIGGFLTGCLYGFAGLRVGAEAPDAWPRRPVILPSGWKAIEVERIWARGHGASLTASHGAERAIVRMRQDGDQSAMLQHVGD